MYISAEELKESVIEAKSAGYLTDRLAKHLMTISTGVSLHRYHRNYSFREDLAATALVALARHWDKADPEGSIFNYYSRICFNEIGEEIQKHRYLANMIDEINIDNGQDPSAGYEGRMTNKRWADEQAKIKAQRLAYQEKQNRKTSPTPRAWNPNQPKAFVFNILPEHVDMSEKELVRLAYMTCNTLNIMPESIIWRINDCDIGSIPFDRSRRTIPSNPTTSKSKLR